MVSPQMRKVGVKELQSAVGLSERQGCRLLSVSRSCARYIPRVKGDEGFIRNRIWGLAHEYKRYGYRRITELLQRSGVVINKKRVHRLWKAEGLSLRHRKARKRRYGEKQAITQKAERANQVWSYDFMEDRTEGGGVLKILNIVDEYTREGLRIRIERRIDSAKVIKTLGILFLVRGIPEYLRSDNGPEFIAKAIKEWLSARGCKTLYIEPGSPWENPYIESFNGKVRDEFLNMNIFGSVKEAQKLAEGWLREYNEFRPHSSLGYKTPREFARISGSCAPGCIGPSRSFQSPKTASVVNL